MRNYEGGKTMKFGDLFENWGLKSLKLNWKFVEAEFSPEPDDQDAAWEMYVYLITTILTQKLPDEDGDEQAALDSVYRLFGVTRNILTEYGRKAKEFTKIAVVVLNQKVRPFTAKWHKLSLAGAFNDAEQRKKFRQELATVQADMRHYAGLLANIAQVEDITDIEDA